MLFWDALTYPLNLIHENVEFMLLNTFAGIVNKYFPVVIVVLWSCFFIVHQCIENC